jgi:hypothetical protein
MPPRRCLPALLLFGCLGCAGLRGGPASSDCGPRGCSFVHRLGDPPPHLVQACKSIPPEARERVHLFVINGLDPLYLGNLNGLCACMQQLGFANVHCGQLWQAAAFRDQIGAIRRADPQARIALLGYSAGANRVCRLAQELQTEGVAIDLLVYLGGDQIENTPACRPANVGQVLNITGHGFLLHGGDLFRHGADLDGARNERLDTRHLLLPTRGETVELLAVHLIAIAHAPAPACRLSWRPGAVASRP